MKKNIILLSVISVVVLFTVIYGFLDGGSPKAARDKRFDETRVQDIQAIKNQVDNHFRTKKALPESLAKSDGYKSSSDSNSDPETGKMYVYRSLGETQYELCATFATSTTGKMQTYLKAFEHDAGDYCFEFTVNQP